MNTKRMMYLIVLSVMLILALGAAASAKIWAGTELGPDEARFPRQGEDPGVKVMADDPRQPDEPVKLIFIHHSCGGHWLANLSETEYPAGGLGQALMENNYFVSATNYGWGPDSIGDRTDIPNWPEWFTGPNSSTHLDALYNESGQNVGDFGAWSRLSDDPGGENEIIMFKSCFPNSDLYGNPDDPPLDEPNDQYTVANAKAVYNDILTYFTTRQDKLFIVITAPPLMESETASDRAANARAFNNWLLNDWLDSYSHDNVAVFDYYNVLTSNGGDVNTNDYDARPTGNHHYWNGSEITHTQTLDNNYSAYPSGDSHPTSAGHRKATAEFVDLLNVFYNRWQAGAGPTEPTLTLTAPNGGESWTVGSEREITWSSTGTIADVSLAYSTDGFATAPVTITASTANDGSHTLTVPDDPSTSVRVRVASVVSPTIRDESDADFAIVSASEVETYTLNAIITPTDATEPVTYAWSPEPHSGQGTDSASYRWAPGAHQVTLAATNCGGTFTDTRIFNVGSTARNQVAASLTQKPGFSADDDLHRHSRHRLGWRLWPYHRERRGAVLYPDLLWRH